jgi:hypothetical protein
MAEIKDSEVQRIDIGHAGHSSVASAQHDREEVTGFEIDETQLPKGYYYSRFFIGSFMAIGLGLWAGTAAL